MTTPARIPTQDQALRHQLKSFLAALGRATNGEPFVFVVEFDAQLEPNNIEAALFSFWRSPLYMEMYANELSAIGNDGDPPERWMHTITSLAAVPMRPRVPLAIAGRMLELLCSRWWYRKAVSLEEVMPLANSFADALRRIEVVAEHLGKQDSEPIPDVDAERTAQEMFQQGLPDGSHLAEFVSAARTLSRSLPSGWRWLSVDPYLSTNLPVHSWWNFPCDEAFVGYKGAHCVLLYVTGAD